MKMYVIVDKYNEDFYYNFELEDFNIIISEKCLIPTKEVAEQYIEDNMGSDNAPAEITIHQIKKDGTWEYSVEDVWANEYKDDEESA